MTLPNLNRALGKLYGEPLPSTEVIKLRGDASTRSYFRVRVADAAAGRPASVIAMQLPADAFRSDEGGNQPDSQRLPFLEVAELLESKGLPVPTIYVEDLGNGIILLEDLGDVTFEQQLRNTPRRRSTRRLDRLAAPLRPRATRLGARSFSRVGARSALWAARCCASRDAGRRVRDDRA
jgi:aminoglycoside/choline kinase family phosphotransferase